MTLFNDNSSDAQWRRQRSRRQRTIALIVILAMALPGGIALWSLVN